MFIKTHGLRHTRLWKLAAEHSIRGKLVTADMYGVDSDILNDRAFLTNILTNAANMSGATVLEDISYRFKPMGVTVAVILSESHITCHTYPEKGFIAIDCYTCGPNCEPMKAIDYLMEVLHPKDGADIKEVERGTRDGY